MRMVINLSLDGLKNSEAEKNESFGRNRSRLQKKPTKS